MDYQAIFNSLSYYAQYHNGVKLLSKIKKKHNCTTDDILKAQEPHKEKKICGVISVISYTSIFDYGITNDDLKNSRLKDLKLEAKRIVRKGADVSSFGDPVEWQKKERTERKIK